jgi:hypothetical protein
VRRNASDRFRLHVPLEQRRALANYWRRHRHQSVAEIELFVPSESVAKSAQIRYAATGIAYAASKGLARAFALARELRSCCPLAIGSKPNFLPTERALIVSVEVKCRHLTAGFITIRRSSRPTFDMGGGGDDGHPRLFDRPVSPSPHEKIAAIPPRV